jgi:hypothetical protein
MVRMVGQANRIYNVNNETTAGATWTSGQMSNTHSLITNKYMGALDWSAKPYNVYSCNPSTGAGGGCCGSGLVSCATRKSSGEANGTGRSPYSGWGYTMSDTGTLTATGGAPVPAG